MSDLGKDLIKALKNFDKASSELLDAWVKADNDKKLSEEIYSDGSLMNKYPFAKTFDELKEDISEWVTDSIDQIEENEE